MVGGWWLVVGGWIGFFFAHFDFRVDRRPELREDKPRYARNNFVVQALYLSFCRNQFHKKYILFFCAAFLSILETLAKVGICERWVKKRWAKNGR